MCRRTGRARSCGLSLDGRDGQDGGVVQPAGRRRPRKTGIRPVGLYICSVYRAYELFNPHSLSLLCLSHLRELCICEMGNQQSSGRPPSVKLQRPRGISEAHFLESSGALKSRCISVCLSCPGLLRIEHGRERMHARSNGFPRAEGAFWFGSSQNGM